MTQDVRYHQELVDRSIGLREQLWDDADQCDRLRRLIDRDVEALTGAGLLRLMTPRRFGGHQADMRTLLDVNIALGRGCAAAAWVNGVLNAGNFVVSLFPEQAQREVWADDPDASAALVLGRPGPLVEQADGGALVSGEWAYASGSLHAQWISVLVLVDDGAGPAVHFALLPVGQVQIKDVWHFAGMRGTGSNTVVADRVFVPRHRLLPYQPLLDGETDGLVDPAHPYRNSLTGLFMIGLVGSMIGGAKAACEHVRATAGVRPVAGSRFANQAESPMFRLGLARATLAAENAELLARRIAETVDAVAADGGNADLLTRARARMESTRVAEGCRESVEHVMTAYGSSAFNDANPLQRIWRDIHVGSRHAGFGMGVPDLVYGHALVGMDPREISPLV